MNIFFTSVCPKESAQNLCQRHIIKMILESAQMLSTAHRECGTSVPLTLLYKSTHKNHPSSVWVRKSVHHYFWLYSHFCSLCDLYTSNTGKVHKTDTKLREVLAIHPSVLPLPFRLPPMCMPDEFKSDNVCKSYQTYLTNKYQEWQTRDKPLKVIYPHGSPSWYTNNTTKMEKH